MNKRKPIKGLSIPFLFLSIFNLITFIVFDIF